MEPKQKTKAEGVEVQNPFSDKFLETWDYWKRYKKEQFKFTYKPIGEDGALKKLYALSEGDEVVAKKIIEEAIANGWMGLYALKNNNNGTNPKGFAPKPAPTGNVPAGGFGQL